MGKNMMIMMLFVSVILLKTNGVEGYFWGFDTHEIACEIAERNLTFTASEQIAKLIGPGGLVSVATWADQVRGSPAYSWTSPLHYINPKHDPMQNQCSFSYTRDCPNVDQCVVGAVFNFTNQLAGKIASPNEEEAVKFLAHFIPDMHNPMHVCGIYLGGNDFTLKFFGQSTNLHKVWDTDIPLRRIKELGSKEAFTQEIIEKLDTIWASEVESWITCKGNSKTKICPDQWAATVEPYNCRNCWVGVNQIGMDLRDDYYNNNWEVLEKLVAMSAVRLAATFNELFV